MAIFNENLGKTTPPADKIFDIFNENNVGVVKFLNFKGLPRRRCTTPYHVLQGINLNAIHDVVTTL